MSGQTYTIYLIEDHRMKPYVGITTKKPTVRLKEHRASARRGTEGHLYNAMRKYGTDKFEIIQLEVLFDNRKAAYQREKHWIARLDTYEGWGYNMTPGGETPPVPTGKDAPFYGKSHSEETKQKMSRSTRGSNNPMYGVTGEAHPGCLFGEENPMYGKTGEDNPRSKLSRESAQQIKWLALHSELVQSKIGDRYNVTKQTVSEIKNEKKWSHIDPKKPTNYNA